MPGSISRASGTPFGSAGSASSFSTPIQSDWISLTPFSRSSVPAGGVASSAMSISSFAESRKRSCGSACCRSGSQNSAFSVSLAKRMFTGAGMVAFERGGLDAFFVFIVGGSAWNSIGIGAGLAEAETDSHRRRLRPGQHYRSGRAPGGAEARRSARPVGGGGEQGRRGRQRRQPAGEARGARRLHAPRDERRVRRQSQPLRERRL